MAALSTVAGCRFRGTITSWKAPWGWVNSADLGSDFFVHEEDIVSGVLSKGAQVSFEVGTDPKSGRPRAKQIQVIAEATAEVYGPRIEGVVSSWREPWGWFSCASEEKDIFAHREDIISPGAVAPLEAGSTVTFHLGTDPKTARRRALRIELPMQDGQEGRLQGIVTTWKDRWGWVKCAEVTDGDIFAHTEDMPPGLCPQPGQGITFELGADGKGRRRARKCQLLMGGAKGSGCNPGMMMNAGMPMVMGSLKRPAAGGKRGLAQGQLQGQMHGQLQHQMQGHLQGQLQGQMQGQMQGQVQGQLQGQMQHQRQGQMHFQMQGQNQFGAAGFQQAPTTQALASHGGAAGQSAQPGAGAAQFLGQRMTGLVMSWKDRWGWISNESFGGDLFAHLEDVPAGTPLIVGSQVSFSVGKDQQGRIRAKQIQVLQLGPLPALPMVGVAGPNKKRKTVADPTVFEGLDGQPLEGEVKSWKSPWGWIRAPGVNGDIFAHRDDVYGGEELTVGQFVSFVMGRDPKTHRWRARNIGGLQMPSQG